MHSYPSYDQAPPKLIAGARCLDFLNTVEEHQTDRLTGYGEFVIWAKAASLIDVAQQRRLLALAAKQPQARAMALRLVLKARRALADLFGGPKSRHATAMAAINGILVEDRFVLQLEACKGGFRDNWGPDCPALRRPLLILLREASELLASPALAHVHYCANGDCRWFFLDTSRNQSRRWCQMETCGNQAKARAHYRRHRVVSRVR